jgi:hypothetical protein
MRKLTLLLILASCAPQTAIARDAGAPGREFEGVYELGFERHTFRPCGSRETWWVGIAPAELQRGLGTRAFMRVRGTVGERGGYGHLARYPRQIIITEVVSTSGERCAARKDTEARR